MPRLSHTMMPGKSPKALLAYKLLVAMKIARLHTCKHGASTPLGLLRREAAMFTCRTLLTWSDELAHAHSDTAYQIIN